MQIPLFKEESLRKSEVVAYDPFILSSRVVTGPTFLYEASYNLGDEVFDGTFYHEVVANSPNTLFTSGLETPTWNTALNGTTISGTVKFQNIGRYSRKYGRTDEVFMRIGHGSFAFVQIAFPQTVTPTVDDVRLVLTSPVFQMNSSSEVLLAPTVVFDPSLVSASIYASGSLSAYGITTMQQAPPLSYAVENEFTVSSGLIANGSVYFWQLGTYSSISQKEDTTWVINTSGLQANRWTNSSIEIGWTPQVPKGEFGIAVQREADGIITGNSETQIFVKSLTTRNYPDITPSGNGFYAITKNKPDTYNPLVLSYADSEMTAELSKLRMGVANFSVESGLDTQSLVVGMVNPQYEPLNFDEVDYPTTWPPDYLDTSTLTSVGIPRFGEKVSIDLSSMINSTRSVYTLMVFHMSDSVWTGATVTNGQLVGGKLKNISRNPIMIGGDESGSTRPYAQPDRNRRTLEQSIGGPYLGYILDTYETTTGITHPVPWFDAPEAKRIAARMTETNFFATEPGLEVKVEYNSSSQEFVITQTDFRTIEGFARNGIKTELQRISPVRIGSRLLYPIGSYDIPWLLVRTDYNPNPIIRIKGALPLTIASSSGVVDAVFTKAN